MQIDLDESTVAQLERRAVEHEFESVEEYTTILVETVLEELEGPEQEEDTVEDRLKDLGYL